MKRSYPSHDKKRFGGNLRHYHRAGGAAPRTWDEWVEGDARRAKSNFKWLRFVGILLAVIALGGIVAGLVIELK